MKSPFRILPTGQKLDTVVLPSFNPNVGKNQHRWKDWVDTRVREILESGAEDLEWAWKRDRKYPKSYPVNTWYMFAQIEEQLQNRPPKGVQSTGIKRSPPPQTLSDLVGDNIIRFAYEDQNEGSYKEALKHARAGFGKGHRVFRKILRAIETAYLIELYNFDHAPTPRV